MGKIRKTISALGIIAALLAVAPSRAMVFDVNVDTSPLGLSTHALMAFDLTNYFVGDNHSVRIFDFTTTGTLLNCAGTLEDPCPSYATNPYVAPPISSPYLDAPAGLISGTLDPGPSLFLYGTDDSLSFLSYYQNITVGGPGSFIRFRFEIIGSLTDVGANDPDGFSLTLLSQPEPDPDPPLVLEPLLPTLPGGPLFNFSFNDVSDPCVSAEGTDCVRGEDIPSVPEPGALVLALAGLLALAVVCSAKVHPLRRQTTI